MKEPLISVVLPVFNAEAHLRTTLLSIVDQTESDFEVLAIDDGSSDGSLAILREFAARDPRITVLRQANAGLSSARNFGLEHACGRWVLFVDSDDWMAPTLLEVSLRCAETVDLDIVFGNCFLFGTAPDEAPVKAHFVRQPWGRILSGQEWLIECSKQREWRNFAWNQLIRRDLIVRIGLRFVEGVMHEDIMWTTRLALAARRVMFIREPLYGYRGNQDSITRSLSTLVIARRVESYLSVVAMLMDSADSHSAILKRAIKLHAHHQSIRCMTLLRRKMHDRVMRRKLATKILRSGAPGAAMSGARKLLERWRAIREIVRTILFAFNCSRQGSLVQWAEERE